MTGANILTRSIIILVNVWRMHGRIELDFTSSQEQLADVLTKSLGRVKFQELRGKIGVVEVK